ncbi:MAG: CAP domain-containing protein [Trueperaceae bacterium]
MARLVVLLLFLSVAAANGLPVVTDPPSSGPAEAALLVTTNEARARHGLPPLGHDEGLARAARAHAIEMANLAYFSHSSPSPESSSLSRRLARAGVPSVTAGENLALLRGPQDVATAAVQGWLESPGHRAALLHTGYTHVGFGVATGAGGETLVAQVFGRLPRTLRRATVNREPRGGFELNVLLEVPTRLTVLPRLAGTTGEVLTLEPGTSELVLHTDSSEAQQLVMATALDDAGHYVIQDGGWITPETGSWRADGSMPRSSLTIAGVSASEARGQIVRLELEYDAGPADLVVFVNGNHYRNAEIGPGHLLIYLPAGRQSDVQVGEAAGSLVTQFDGFTVLPGMDGPLLLPGQAP